MSESSLNYDSLYNYQVALIYALFQGEDGWQTFWEIQYYIQNKIRAVFCAEEVHIIVDLLDQICNLWLQMIRIYSLEETFLESTTIIQAWLKELFIQAGINVKFDEILQIII